jgi:hypothetical protein
MLGLSLCLNLLLTSHSPPTYPHPPTLRNNTEDKNRNGSSLLGPLPTRQRKSVATPTLLALSLSISQASHPATPVLSAGPPRYAYLTHTGRTFLPPPHLVLYAGPTSQTQETFQTSATPTLLVLSTGPSICPPYRHRRTFPPQRHPPCSAWSCLLDSLCLPHRHRRGLRTPATPTLLVLSTETSKMENRKTLTGQAHPLQHPHPLDNLRERKQANIKQTHLHRCHTLPGV